MGKVGSARWWWLTVKRGERWARGKRGERQERGKRGTMLGYAKPERGRKMEHKERRATAEAGTQETWRLCLQTPAAVHPTAKKTTRLSKRKTGCKT